MNTKTAVIIPAYNEALSIGKVVSAIPRNLADEIIVVNNNSTDGTAAEAEKAGATVLYEQYPGYGAACLKGIGYCKNRNFDTIVFMDGDYSDYPEEIELLLNKMKEGYDFVLGSRTLGKREKGALPIQSRIGSIIAGFLINFFWGYKFTDLGPFRAIRMKTLLGMDMRDKWYGWTVEMQIKAARQKIKTIEIPVSYRNRIGKSKVTGTLKGTVMASVIILSTIFKYAFTRKK